MTSDDIRKQLTRYDSFFHRVSKTKSIMDKEYADITDDELALYIALTRDQMKFFNVKYRPNVFDCENFASLFIAVFDAIWSLDDSHQFEVPKFRCVVDFFSTNHNPTPHAVVIVHQPQGIKFIEPQTFELMPNNQKVLEVA